MGPSRISPQRVHPCHLHVEEGHLAYIQRAHAHLPCTPVDEPPQSIETLDLPLVKACYVLRRGFLANDLTVQAKQRAKRIHLHARDRGGSRLPRTESNKDFNQKFSYIIFLTSFLPKNIERRTRTIPCSTHMIPSSLVKLMLEPKISSGLRGPFIP